MSAGAEGAGDAAMAWVGRRWLTLFNDLRDWQETTFGTARERGPLGPLRHLQKELETEIIPLAEAGRPVPLGELVDVLVLLVDATWRSGYDANDLLRAAEEKLPVLRGRFYRKPPPGSDEVSEHDRSLDQ